MKLLPKHRMLTLLVASSAGRGIPLVVVLANMVGAWGVGWAVARPYSTRVPANSAWFPAESTEVKITVFMNDPAISDGASEVNAPTTTLW